MQAASDSTTNRKLEWLMDMQKNEAQLHWTRNNYFIVTSSILLLALSQFNSSAALKGIISLVGIGFELVWLAIQDRSSKYIGYWKKSIQELDTGKQAIFPPDLRGIQMRYVAYLLPTVFLLMWVAILGAILLGANV